MSGPYRCSACGGTGQIETISLNDPDEVRRCPECNGSGERWLETVFCPSQEDRELGCVEYVAGKWRFKNQPPMDLASAEALQDRKKDDLRAAAGDLIHHLLRRYEEGASISELNDIGEKALDAFAAHAVAAERAKPTPDNEELARAVVDALEDACSLGPREVEDAAKMLANEFATIDDEARRAERERCAQIVEEACSPWQDSLLADRAADAFNEGRHGTIAARLERHGAVIAAAIRALPAPSASTPEAKG